MRHFPPLPTLISYAVKALGSSSKETMNALIHALEGLPGFVGQLDLHQHSYDTSIAARLVIHGEEYLELLQVLYMLCEQAMDSQETIEDLWMLFGIVQQKLILYVDLLGSNRSRDDVQSTLNGALASSVSQIVLPTRGLGRLKMFVSRAQTESLFEPGIYICQGSQDVVHV